MSVAAHVGVGQFSLVGLRIWPRFRVGGRILTGISPTACRSGKGLGSWQPGADAGTRNASQARS